MTAPATETVTLPSESTYIAVKRDKLGLIVLAAGGFCQEHTAPKVREVVEEFAAELGIPQPPWVK